MTKFFYGVIADQVPIMGSRKKSWLVIMGLIQFISMTAAATFDFNNPNLCALVLSLMSFSGAFIDVIMEAMMVIEAKKYPATGS